jgi:hypothetical protein
VRGRAAECRAAVEATIWRVATGADAAAVDAVTGAWLMEQASAAGNPASAGRDRDDDTPLIPVRVDGKTVRGARNPDGSQVHRRRPAVWTADVLHAQRATAAYVHGRGADFAFLVKDNPPGLLDALDGLPWRDVPVTRTATDWATARITTRAIQVLDAPRDLPFPHVSQAYLIERHVTALDGTPLSDIAALGITSLDATRASPETIASLVRASGRLSPCTGYLTPSTAKTTRPSAPAPGHGPWPPSGTSPTAHSTRPGGTIPPKPPAGPAAASTGLSPSSDSHHDLETAGIPE